MDTETIRDAVRQRPFRAFTLRMNDGRELYVPHPEMVAVSTRVVFAIDEKTQRGSLLEPALIASLQFDATPEGQSAQGP